MNINPLTHNELEEVSEWLADLNEQDDHFVAWLESGREAIQAQLTPLLSFESTLLWISRNEERIVGFLGILPFFEQKICRLLGPFTTEDSYESMNKLWEKALPVAQEHFDIAKVAFFKQNQSLKRFSEEQGFYCYNSETSLLLPKEKALKENLITHHIDSYQEKYEEDIRRLHPQAAFYTSDELFHHLKDPHNHLWCYVYESHVKGYVYFEEIIGTGEGELCFVNVEEGERDQGIGRALIQYACHKAFQDYGLSLVTISVRSGNPKAKKLYQELGFLEGPTIYAYEKKIGEHEQG